MRITKQYRAEQLLLQRQAILNAQVFGKNLLKSRLSVLSDAVKKLEEIPVSKWVDFAPTLLEEPKLKDWYNKLYITTGLPMAKVTVNNFLNRKTSNDMWQQALNKWLSKNAGSKVKIINDSFKEFFADELRTTLGLSNEFGRYSVEQMVQYLDERLKSRIPEMLEWQTRRIIQTESLTALSVAGNESIKELGMNYTKTWGISGHNTRPAHAAMDGVTIQGADVFNVDGEQMEYPRDTQYGASAENIINCSCFVIYSPV